LKRHLIANLPDAQGEVGSLTQEGAPKLKSKTSAFAGAMAKTPATQETTAAPIALAYRAHRIRASL
jgi:hypothetical protein